MTYNEYVQYLLRFLWREGDTALESDAEFYIRAAEARLRRDLRTKYTEAIAQTLRTVTSNEYVLPDNIERISLLREYESGLEIAYIVPSKLAELAANNTQFLPYYTIIGNTLRFIGKITPTDTLRILIDYHAGVPSLKDDDTSWVLDRYFDLYHTAVLCETNYALKSDARAQLFESRYAAQLESVYSADAGDTLNITTGYLPSGIY